MSSLVLSWSPGWKTQIKTHRLARREIKKAQEKTVTPNLLNRVVQSLVLLKVSLVVLTGWRDLVFRQCPFTLNFCLMWSNIVYYLPLIILRRGVGSCCAIQKRPLITAEGSRKGIQTRHYKCVFWRPFFALFTNEIPWLEPDRDLARSKDWNESCIKVSKVSTAYTHFVSFKSWASLFSTICDTHDRKRGVNRPLRQHGWR